MCLAVCVCVSPCVCVCGCVLRVCLDSNRAIYQVAGTELVYCHATRKLFALIFQAAFPVPTTDYNARYLAILNFPTSVFTNFPPSPKMRMRISIERCVKVLLAKSRRNLKNNLNNEQTKAKSSTSIASCSCYCWSPSSPLFPFLHPLSLAIVPLLLSCLCQMKCSAKAACNERRC